MRNKRILVVSADPKDGTSFYRAWGPLSRIENVEIVAATDVTWPTLSTIDILFVQRPSHQINVQMIAEAKKFNTPIWIEFDDDGLHLEPCNPAYEYFNLDEKQAAIKECLRLADICTVSTQHLKEIYLEAVPTANIVVVPNAVDETLFDLTPSLHERNKIIALRGGSSHVNDWGQYKDVVLQLAKENPDWTWAIMGFHPEWMNQIENIKIYEFTTIPGYFEKLMELRPAIGIVPLTDTLFNRSKSNIGAQELTLAGAAILASDLPEFRLPGIGNFSRSVELIQLLSNLIFNPSLRQECYETTLDHLPRLHDVNEIRKDVIEQLTIGRKKLKPLKRTLPVYEDKEFHDHELAYGFTPDYEVYCNLNERTAKWLIDVINPRSALELGCGVGGTMIELLKRNVNVVGFERNAHSVKYFKDRYPVFQNQIIETDITKEPIEVDSVGDLVYSIECFEHIDMPEDWWNQYLTDLSKKFRHFYFSSTPFHSIESFDVAWGHVNVRIMSRWKKLFETNGWELVSNPRITSLWDLHFKSKNID